MAMVFFSSGAAPGIPSPASVAAGSSAADVRPDTSELADTLAAFDAPAGDAAHLTEADLQPLLFQWIAVLEAGNVGELAGLTDDLRTLAAALDERAVVASVQAVPVLASALHRAGLSLERVAAWARPAGRTQELLLLGQRLVTLSEEVRH
jgi:hypothetical protein